MKRLISFTLCVCILAILGCGCQNSGSSSVLSSSGSESADASSSGSQPSERIDFVKSMQNNNNTQYAIEEREVGTTPFPEEMMNHTEEEKQAQRKAADDIISGLRQAVSEGKKEYRIPDGYYRFGKGIFKSFVIVGLSDFKIIGGDGVHFIQETQKDVLVIQDCSNIMVEGITLDYDPLPFIQCTVKEYDMTNDHLVVTVDEHYRAYMEQWNLTPSTHQRILYFDGQDTSKQITVSANDAVLKKFENVGANDYEVTLNGKFYSMMKVPLKIGDKFVIPVRGGGNPLKVINCSDVVIKDVDIYASYGLAVLEQGGDGGNYFNGLRIIRRPGTDRLATSAADGFHSISVKAGATLDRCEISYTEDDLMNVHGFIGNVVERHSETEYTVVYPLEAWMEEGAAVTLFDMADYSVRDTAQVIKVEEVTDELVLARIDQVRKDLLSTKVKNIREFNTPHVYRIKLDKAVDGEYLDGVSSESYCSKGLTVKNSYFHDGQARGMIIHGPDALIENNIIKRVNSQALLINGGGVWSEGPLPLRVTVRNNLFEQTNQSYEGIIWPGAVAIYAENYNNRMSTANNLLRDITVEDNEFLNIRSNAVFAYNTQGLTVKNNKISGCYKDTRPAFFESGSGSALAMGMDSPFYAVFVDYCDKVTIVGNKITDNNTAYCNGDIGIGKHVSNQTVS